jgi:hypothetical protein
MSLQAQIDKKRKDIKTDGYPMSISEWISMYQQDELDIHPEFQRFFRWSLAQNFENVPTTRKDTSQGAIAPKRSAVVCCSIGSRTRCRNAADITIAPIIMMLPQRAIVARRSRFGRSQSRRAVSNVSILERFCRAFIGALHESFRACQINEGA